MGIRFSYLEQITGNEDSQIIFSNTWKVSKWLVSTKVDVFIESKQKWYKTCLWQYFSSDFVLSNALNVNKATKYTLKRGAIESQVKNGFPSQKRK